MFRLAYLVSVLALLLAGCKSSVPPTGSSASALSSCSSDPDPACTVPAGSGAAVDVTCSNHACTPTTKMGGCSGGDCAFNNGCTNGTCVAGSCVFSGPITTTTAGCCTDIDLSHCNAANACQTLSCNVGSCTYTAKSGKACCNSSLDCASQPGVVSGCTNNTCTCVDGSKHYCGSVTMGSHCVTGSECCVDSDCGGGSNATCVDGTCTCGTGLLYCGSAPSGACHQCCAPTDCTVADPTCQTATCSPAGVCGSMPKTIPGCCTSDGQCTNGTCTTNECSCPVSDTFCPGASNGGICCPPVANGIVGCVANACSLACNSNFHSCGGANSCVAAGTTSCGASCKDCTAGLSTCQTGACSDTTPSGTCSVMAKNMTGCCASNTSLGNCTAPSMCQTLSCDSGNRCAYTAIVGGKCCSNTNPCKGSATCGSDNICACASNMQKYCPGAGCIPNSGCCVDGDCTGAIANGTAKCNTTMHTCVVDTCNNTFHACTASNSCQPDTSITACGASCVTCPGPMNNCETTVCTSGACAYTKSGGLPCCNAVGECTGNSCQTASACTNNTCVFTGKTNVAGCCNPATVNANCPPPSDPCLMRTCVANQCATSPIAGCVPDMSRPDMSRPRDMAGAPDLAVADMTGAPDLTLSDLARGRDLLPQVPSLTGGGGCAVAVATGGEAAPVGLLALFALTFSLALRRRRR